MANDGEGGGDAASFVALYAQFVKEPLDAAEFEADDLCAFQAFERALASESEELKELASRLQTRRQESLESIVIDSGEWPRVSRAPKIVVPEPVPATPVAAEPAAAAATTAQSGDATAAPDAPPAPPKRVWVERRAGATRLNPKQIAAATELQRLYHKEFDRALDIARFILDDDYGRSVLRESLNTTSPKLIQASERYLDDEGRSLIHRRGARRANA